MMTTGEGARRPQLKGDASGSANLHAIQFTGSGGEYFKIWIVNIVLSILTLGIYSAWAKVRTKRYFYGNTMLDQAVFEYHATPMMILKGRIVAILVLLAVFSLNSYHPLLELFTLLLILLAAPWVIWRSLLFNARMTSYRNVRFNFRGKGSQLYVYLLLLPALPLAVTALAFALSIDQLAVTALDLTGVEDAQAPAVPEFSGAGMFLGAIAGMSLLAFYLLMPYLQKLLTSYYLNNHGFGQGAFHGHLNTSFYYLTYLQWFLLSIVVALLAIIVMAMLAMVLGLGWDTLDAGVSSNPQLQGQNPLLGLIFAPLVAVPIWLRSYLTCKFHNYLYGNAQLDSVAALSSNMKVNTLFAIHCTNLLLLVFTLGLARPWTLVRLTRYKLETLTVSAEGDIDQYVTQMQQQQSALGDELGEAFGLELGLAV